MDEFLAALGAQAMKYAIRSGIALTSSYAIGQCSRLLNSIGNPELHAELKTRQQLLEAKLRIISPAFDLIELKSGRGNVFLDSALPLVQSLRQEIDALGQRTEELAVRRETGVSRNKKSDEPDSQTRQLQVLMTDISALISRIDRETPLIQLAITASGETLSTSMPPSISPSRLLQASTLLTIGDTHHSQYSNEAVQIGPSFCLTLFMLFVGHAPTSTSGLAEPAPPEATDADTVKLSTAASYGFGEGERKPLWQEIIHKARVRLCRAPHHHTKPVPSAEKRELPYAYYLEIIEDLDDDRFHSDTEDSPSFSGIAKTGIKENISINHLSKLFYTDSGKLLNITQDIEGGNHPVLLIKRESTTITESNSSAAVRLEKVNGLGESEAAIERQSECEDEQALIDQQLGAEWRTHENTRGAANLILSEQHHSRASFPKHLDPDWIAMEMFQADAYTCQDSDMESVAEDDDPTPEKPFITARSASNRLSVDSQLEAQILGLSLRPTESPVKPSAWGPSSVHGDGSVESNNFVGRSPFGAITTSLSLLEMLIRLASLQEYQQAPHLSIPDHILTFFLEQTSSTGLAGDAGVRVREEARKKVGFDPYSDLPSEAN